MIEHQVDDHARDRDVQPHRERPARDPEVRDELPAKRPAERHDDERHYRGREHRVRDQHRKVEGTRPTRPFELRRPDVEVINQIRDQKHYRRGHRAHHARAVGFDLLAPDHYVTCHEQREAGQV